MKDLAQRTIELFKVYIEHNKRGICLQIIKLNYRRYQDMNILKDLIDMYFEKWGIKLKDYGKNRFRY
jgi:hypothetical protein